MNDNLELAAILVNKMNPLVLGEYDSAMKIAEEYQKELLLLRMFKKEDEVQKLVEKFSKGFTHHSRVIDAEAAQELFGRKRIKFWKEDKKEWKLLWEIYTNNRTILNLIDIINQVDGNIN